MAILSSTDFYTPIIKNNSNLSSYLALGDQYYEILQVEFDINTDYLPTTPTAKVKRVLSMYVQWQMATDFVGQTSLQQAQGNNVDPWIERMNAWKGNHTALRDDLSPIDFYDASNLPETITGKRPNVARYTRG